MKKPSLWTLRDAVPTDYVVTQEGDNMVIKGKEEGTVQLDISGGFPIVKVTGTVIYRDHCGEVKQLAQFRNGELHGIVLDWMGCACTPAQGHLYEKRTYRHGKPVGIRTWWYRSGQLWGIARYDSTGEASLNTVWYENGNRMYHGRFIREHTPDGVHTNWHKDGTLESVQRWEAGRLVETLEKGTEQREQSPEPYR
jgi:antitoxin component YwqK of YwqJK toxin-antitoxin module